jgi:hypothetical protein
MRALAVRLLVLWRGERWAASRHLERCRNPACPCWRDDAVYPASYLRW